MDLVLEDFISLIDWLWLTDWLTDWLIDLQTQCTAKKVHYVLLSDKTDQGQDWWFVDSGQL